MFCLRGEVWPDVRVLRAMGPMMTCKSARLAELGHGANP